MTILITGGNGFIGQKCIEKLITSNEKIISLDVNNRNQKLIQHENVHYQQGNIQDFNVLEEVINKFEITKILHLAYLLAGTSEDEPLKAVHVNVLGSSNVFEIAKTSEVKKIVFISSLAVYGLLEDIDYEKIEVTEDFRPIPTTVYGMCKFFNEMIADRYNKNYEMDIVVVRAPIVAGYGRKTGITTWVSDFASAPALGTKAKMPLKSTQKCLLVYVENLADYLVYCLNNKTGYQLYNCPAYTVTISELCNYVKNYLPKAQFEFNEDAHELPWTHRWNASRLENESGIKLPPLEVSIKNHIQTAQLHGK